METQTPIESIPPAPPATAPQPNNQKKIIAIIVFLLLYGIGMVILVNRFVFRPKTNVQNRESVSQQQIAEVTPTPTPICPEAESARSVDEAVARKENICAVYISSHSEVVNAANNEVIEDAPRTGNAIGTLPDSIGDMKTLKVLQANRSDLMSVPSTLHLAQNLMYVSLSTNNFRIIPAEIFALPNLVALDMSRNMIMDVPPGISKLTRLEHLFLYGNRISALPSEIGDLQALTILQLSENRITTLPGSMKNLTNLKDLYLEKNPLNPGELERIKAMLPNTNVHF